MTWLYRALITLCLGMVLGLLLAIGAIVHSGAQTSPGADRAAQSGTSSRAVTYVRNVNAALQRYDIARREGDRLLTERDANPRLAENAAWRQSFESVVQEHQQLQLTVQRFKAPKGAEATQQCLVDGLRLTALGEGLLFDAFGADGHHAYFLSAHGNWDLNLGVRAIARCRVSLASLS